MFSFGNPLDVYTEQYESQESARTSGDISLTSPETTRSSGMYIWAFA